MDVEMDCLCLSDRVIRDVQGVIATVGPTGLLVDDLTREDLPMPGWSGGSGHLTTVARTLARVESGEVEYLVARAPSGYPIAKGGIDYTTKPDTGTLSQLVTAEDLRSLGIGSHLIAVAEVRMRERGVRAAELGVEDDNPRARAFYVRLGYREEVGRESASWYLEDADGHSVLYETELAILRNTL
jgi:ribosomal protein S18 acetylase RimI-like enzyme